mmetsp:Transcript_61015/g.193529  ORF Transcript_61015/g.193529 Transcript_61015/m.193529 type:complete len:1075 (-) Transcript_61015:34-3258(-)
MLGALLRLLKLNLSRLSTSLRDPQSVGLGMGGPPGESGEEPLLLRLRSLLLRLSHGAVRWVGPASARLTVQTDASEALVVGLQVLFPRVSEQAGLVASCLGTTEGDRADEGTSGLGDEGTSGALADEVAGLLPRLLQQLALRRNVSDVLCCREPAQVVLQGGGTSDGCIPGGSSGTSDAADDGAPPVLRMLVRSLVHRKVQMLKAIGRGKAAATPPPAPPPDAEVACDDGSGGGDEGGTREMGEKVWQSGEPIVGRDTGTFELLKAVQRNLLYNADSLASRGGKRSHATAAPEDGEGLELLLKYSLLLLHGCLEIIESAEAALEAASGNPEAGPAIDACVRQSVVGTLLPQLATTLCWYAPQTSVAATLLPVLLRAIRRLQALLGALGPQHQAVHSKATEAETAPETDADAPTTPQLPGGSGANEGEGAPAFSTGGDAAGTSASTPGSGCPSLVHRVLRASKPVTVQSPHPYENLMDSEEKVHVPGALYLTVQFDSRCSTEKGYDYLQVYRSPKRTDPVGGRFSGEMQSKGHTWPSRPLKVAGDTAYFCFLSDSSNRDWGFRCTVTGYVPCESVNIPWAVGLQRSISWLSGRCAAALIADSPASESESCAVELLRPLLYPASRALGPRWGWKLIAQGSSDDGGDGSRSTSLLDALRLIDDEFFSSSPCLPHLVGTMAGDSGTAPPTSPAIPEVEVRELTDYQEGFLRELVSGEAGSAPAMLDEAMRLGPPPSHPGAAQAERAFLAAAILHAGLLDDAMATADRLVALRGESGPAGFIHALKDLRPSVELRRVWERQRDVHRWLLHQRQSETAAAADGEGSQVDSFSSLTVGVVDKAVMLIAVPSIGDPLPPPSSTSLPRGGEVSPGGFGMSSGASVRFAKDGRAELEKEGAVIEEKVLQPGAIVDAVVAVLLSPASAETFRAAIVQQTARVHSRELGMRSTRVLLQLLRERDPASGRDVLQFLAPALGRSWVSGAPVAAPPDVPLCSREQLSRVRDAFANLLQEMCVLLAPEELDAGIAGGTLCVFPVLAAVGHLHLQSAELEEILVASGILAAVVRLLWYRPAGGGRCRGAMA